LHARNLYVCAKFRLVPGGGAKIVKQADQNHKDKIAKYLNYKGYVNNILHFSLVSIVKGGL